MYQTDFFDLFATLKAGAPWPEWLEEWANLRPANRAVLDAAAVRFRIGLPTDAAPLIDKMVASINLASINRHAAQKQYEARAEVGFGLLDEPETQGPAESVNAPDPLRSAADAMALAVEAKKAEGSWPPPGRERKGGDC